MRIGVMIALIALLLTTIVASTQPMQRVAEIVSITWNRVCDNSGYYNCDDPDRIVYAGSTTSQIPLNRLSTLKIDWIVSNMDVPVLVNGIKPGETITGGIGFTCNAPNPDKPGTSGCLGHKGWPAKM